MRKARLLIFIIVVMICTMIPISTASSQEDVNGNENRSHLLEENHINLEDVVHIDYGAIETQPSLAVAFGEMAIHTTQAPITFSFKDGSEKIIMDSVTFTLEYSDVETPTAEQLQSPEAIYLVDCTATYSSSWYGTAKSKTVFQRDTTAHKVRTYSDWIYLFDHIGYWPWNPFGGLYYIDGGTYGSWLDQFTTHHGVYWKMVTWPYSMHTEELVYAMSWAACIIY